MRNRLYTTVDFRLLTNSVLFVFQLRVVQEMDDELTKNQQQQLGDSKTIIGNEQKIIVPRKGSVLSVMGMQELAHNNNNDHHAMTVRAKCVEELLNTEKDYVKMLRNIIEVTQSDLHLYKYCISYVVYCLICVIHSNSWTPNPISAIRQTLPI